MKRFLVFLLSLLTITTILSGCNKAKSTTVHYTGLERDYYWENLSNYLYQDMRSRDPIFSDTLQAEVEMIGKSMDEQHNVVSVTLLCKYDNEVHLLPAVEGCEINSTAENFHDDASARIACEIMESWTVRSAHNSAGVVEVTGAIVTWLSHDAFNNRTGCSAMDCDGDAKWDIVSGGDLSTKSSILSDASDMQVIWSYSEHNVLCIPKNMAVVWLPSTPNDSITTLSAMERLV